MKKSLIAISALALGLGLVFASVGTKGAAEAAPGDCQVAPIGTANTANGPNSKFTKNGTKVTAKFKVTGTNCDEPVTLAAWEAPNAEARPLSAQKLFKYSQNRFKAGTYSLSVDVPQCYFQVDLVRGMKPRGPEGGPAYGPDRNMGWLLGGQQKCDKPQPPAPKPEFSCTLLGIAATNNRSVNVNAFKTAVKNGATYKRAVINWGDGKTTNVTGSPVGTTHQYVKDGTYTVKATAYFTVNGKEVSATSAACAKPVKIATAVAPKTPTYSCDMLGVFAGPNREVSINGFKTTVTNGAVFNNVVINWGDGVVAPATTNVLGLKHQYAKDGTYTVTATAYFTVNGAQVSASGVNCSKVVTYTADKPPVVVTPVTPASAGKTPEALPDTGTGNIVAIFTGITSLAGAGHWFFTRRFL